MYIETIVKDTEQNKGQIVIDDTIDLIITHTGNKYTIEILENKCVDIEVKEVKSIDN